MQNQEANFEDMNTLSSCITSVVKKGYTENFQVNEQGLYAPSKDKHYQPHEVKIDNFYRFEGASNPSDNAILYIVTTHDGVQGAVVDSYGIDTDDNVSDFMRDVEQMHKAEATANK